jgi:hypothetical protein
MPDSYGKHPSVSIIILNYNGREFVERCLKSVLTTDYLNFEVIFIDNASTDGSLELVEKMFGSDPHLKTIRNDENLGFAEGNNVGARVAKGNYIVFLNNDTDVNSKWLKELVEVMESDPTIGIAQSKILLMRDPMKLDCAGGFMDPYGWTNKRGEREKDVGQYDEVSEIFYAHGATMAVKREILEKVGIFDPKFFIYYDDLDLCWRVWLCGYKVVFVPKSVVYHEAGAWGRAQPRPQMTSFFCKNHTSALLKNYSLHNLVRTLPVYIALVHGMAMYLMLKGEVKGALAYFKAILWNLLNLRHVWTERLKVQYLIRKIPDDKLFEKGIILQKPLFLRMLQEQSR